MAREKVEMIGKRFGRLTVIREATPEEKARVTKNRGFYYVCMCDCGNQKMVRGTSLRDGYVKSCGCLRHLKGKDNPFVKAKAETFLEKMKKYEKIKKALCEKYDRKCLTQKCPLARYGCYEFITMSEFFNHIGVNGRPPVEKAIKQAADDLGIEL